MDEKLFFKKKMQKSSELYFNEDPEEYVFYTIRYLDVVNLIKLNFCLLFFGLNIF